MVESNSKFLYDYYKRDLRENVQGQEYDFFDIYSIYYKSGWMYRNGEVAPGAMLSSDFDELINSPFLILDDLGSENTSNWASEKIYQMIVNRHNLRLPTVITTRRNEVEQFKLDWK